MMKGLTLVQLRALASQMKIRGRSKMNKQELLRAIQQSGGATVNAPLFFDNFGAQSGAGMPYQWYHTK